MIQVGQGIAVYGFGTATAQMTILRVTDLDASAVCSAELCRRLITAIARG